MTTTVCFGFTIERKAFPAGKYNMSDPTDGMPRLCAVMARAITWFSSP
jgi:hypothetical protein